MPCLSPTTARTAFRGIKTLHKAHKNVTSSCGILRQYAVTAHATQQSSSELASPATPPNPTPTLTLAQTSRAACKAVHVALKDPSGLNRALHIVNSLHFSNLRHQPNAEDHPFYQKFKDTAIPFDRPIPPGLASTALLHGLLRLGRTKEAGRLAVQMMATGLHLKPKTLTLVHTRLAPPTTDISNPEKLIPVPDFIPNPTSLSEIASMAQTESTRLALDLFAVAENHQHDTKRGMFATLITLCLVNGEIILASLLVAFIAKDAHTRSISTTHAKPEELELSSSVQRGEGEHEQVHEHEPGAAFHPRHIDVRRILKVIDRSFTQTMDGSSSFQSLQIALQALANLASLLEHETIIIPELSTLLRTLYRVPRVGNLVWIVDGSGQPIEVEVYDYAHLVLSRVIERLPTAREKHLSETAKTPPSPESLPTAEPGVRSLPLEKTPRSTSPDLHITVYNTLLNYALRHQFSIPFAERILLHMMRGRQGEPVAPPRDAFNIVLRSGTLLKQPDIAEQAIAAYRTFYPHVVSTNLATNKKDSREGARRRVKRQRDRAFAKLKIDHKNDEHKTAHAVELMTNLSQSRLTKSKWARPMQLHTPGDFIPENHALSNLILHVTSTGSPRVVSSIVMTMFPEIFIPLHRHNPGVYTSVFTPLGGLDLRGRILAKRRAANRGISYGPWVFSALLNALSKAGQSKLAMAVWRLALISEQRSWSTKEPWLLHISAYDSMLKTLSMELRHESTPPAGLTLKQKRLRRRYRSRQASREGIRDSFAFNAAWKVYMNMKSKRQHLRHDFYQYKNRTRELWNKLELSQQVPRPDARWFNSTLNLFILPTLRAKRRAQAAAAKEQQEQMEDTPVATPQTEEASQPLAENHSTPPQRTVDEVWEEFDHLRRINLETGYVSEDWNPFFQVIAEDMLAAGYPIPAGLRYMFIGRWEPGMLNMPEPKKLEQTPYALPYGVEKGKFSPYYLSAPPAKSLALRRRRRDRIARFGLKKARSSRDI